MHTNLLFDFCHCNDFCKVPVKFSSNQHMHSLYEEIYVLFFASFCLFETFFSNTKLRRLEEFFSLQNYRLNFTVCMPIQVQCFVTFPYVYFHFISANYIFKDFLPIVFLNSFCITHVLLYDFFFDFMLLQVSLTDYLVNFLSNFSTVSWSRTQFSDWVKQLPTLRGSTENQTILVVLFNLLWHGTALSIKTTQFDNIRVKKSFFTLDWVLFGLFLTVPILYYNKQCHCAH